MDCPPRSVPGIWYFLELTVCKPAAVVPYAPQGCDGVVARRCGFQRLLVY